MRGYDKNMTTWAIHNNQQMEGGRKANKQHAHTNRLISDAYDEPVTTRKQHTQKQQQQQTKQQTQTHKQPKNEF